MHIEQIKQLPVGDIAEEDAVLWLWTTNAHLNMPFDVVEAWGFECKRSVLRSPRRNTGRPRAASKQGSA
jgi:N6-adenosine-specific RNA methylase IME4